MKPSDFLAPADKIPPGFKTSLQWAAAWKLSVSRTTAILLAAHRAGQVQRRFFRAKCNTCIRRVPFYGKK
jgi:hypothetical protein